MNYQKDLLAIVMLLAVGILIGIIAITALTECPACSTTGSCPRGQICQAPCSPVCPSGQTCKGACPVCDIYGYGY